ncbi:MAG: FKBP-type peptidyl-prolyl cis-trans isomerase [Candidatus Omnitrophica bacterium]|nr:FKBP-type peptidyl-prolyl cis-trans isomerase [Candidatus Omnitrophota bacterium]
MKTVLGIGAVLCISLLFPSTGQAEENLMIQDGSKIKLHYTLKIDDEIVDSTVDQDPIEFDFGAPGLLPSFQENIRGLAAGDQKSFKIQSEDAFGPRDPNAIVEVPREKLPPGEIKEGMVFSNENEGHPVFGLVLEVKDNVVVLDFNHPFAGKDLQFDVSILEVS